MAVTKTQCIPEQMIYDKQDPLVGDEIPDATTVLMPIREVIVAPARLHTTLKQIIKIGAYTRHFIGGKDFEGGEVSIPVVLIDLVTSQDNWCIHA